MLQTLKFYKIFQRDAKCNRKIPFCMLNLKHELISYSYLLNASHVSSEYAWWVTFLRYTLAKPLCSSANGARKIIKNCTFVHRHSKDLLGCAEHPPHAASQLLDDRRYSFPVCFPTPLFSYAIYTCSCWDGEYEAAVL